ncbi:hypothetical protein KXV95_002210 [Aspergillus fumigatus]|nr:hypothetical protein KXX63_003571 [Aspergillus fumigatus]KAH1405407.1 hypothetical protein KXX22_001580 [Aspergillus fumigatus]KAH1587486.1 hypothetical protein KXX34_006721 [Aspergillus fumigatus]KAH1681589.1 hypothetical protein KXX12_005979 [Aspergillus fumigatus]KAH1780726.1 hypothetical protein KXX07_007309 [Aspergillus fumigatus]
MSSSIPPLPPNYRLHDGYPAVADYLHLRAASGLTPKTKAQATVVAQGSWYGCYVTFEDESSGTSTPVGMGRIIGDGGWYFHIADMAVLPDHQRKGLGDIILKTLLAKIRSEAPEGKPYVNLLADPPGRKLYAKNGFVESAPKELGMMMVMDRGIKVDALLLGPIPPPAIQCSFDCLNNIMGHSVISPAIFYWGTPVVLATTVNEDGTPNIAPISSAWWLGNRAVLGLGRSSQTIANIIRTRQCVLNLPGDDMVQCVNALARTTGAKDVPASKTPRGYRDEKDKFGIAGLTPESSHLVQPPRISGMPGSDGS